MAVAIDDGRVDARRDGALAARAVESSAAAYLAARRDRSRAPSGPRAPETSPPLRLLVTLARARGDAREDRPAHSGALVSPQSLPDVLAGEGRRRHAAAVAVGASGARARLGD